MLNKVEYASEAKIFGSQNDAGVVRVWYRQMARFRFRASFSRARLLRGAAATDGFNKSLPARNHLNFFQFCYRFHGADFFSRRQDSNQSEANSYTEFFCNAVSNAL